MHLDERPIMRRRESRYRTGPMTTLAVRRTLRSTQAPWTVGAGIGPASRRSGSSVRNGATMLGFS
jgi:hypothetical protein